MSTKQPRAAFRVAVGALTLAMGIVGLSMPASAHTQSEAIAAGCGSTYRYVKNKPMLGASGSTVGYVIIANVPGTQRFCALTNKIASHGSGTDTYVCLAHRGLWDDYCRRGSYAHFANITAWDGGHRCIIARGRFKTTNNVWASAETVLLHANGASCA
jgi:hypothetical protein